MRILGSSGNACTPWPTCECRVCTRARTHEGKDVRYGNHLFIPDIGLLTDASEHVFSQLNRFSIKAVDHLVLTHWHPDHTAGLRIIQAISGTFFSENPRHLRIYLTRPVYEAIIEKISPALNYYLSNTHAELVFLEDGVAITIGPWTITPVTAPERPGGPHTITFFLFERDGRRVFFAPDETKYLSLERDELANLDVLIKEIGYFTQNPLGERILIENEKTYIPHEVSFEESLAQIERIAAKRTILTELEESYQRTHDEYEELARAYPSLNLEIAYDGMEIE